MRSEKIDVDEPPVALEGSSLYVMLLKDKKNICRIKSDNFPLEVPTCWAISDFRSSSIYRELDLPRCQLYPQPENDYQKNEWGIFMYYLWNRAKVAVVNLKNCHFYLFAPDEFPQFTHIIALYKLRKARRTSDDQERSGENFNQLRNFSEENIPHFCKNGRILQTSRVSVSTVTDGIFGRNFVRTDPSYLRTLSQTHAGWAFGAIAELIDNSCDANAARLAISVEYLYSKKAGEKIPVLSVVDDGVGMSHQDIMRMLSFGHKQPDEENADRIGRFGIGFKTGAMKLGRDVLVLTQSNESRSVAFLSQSYNERKENLEIPIITYHKLGGFMEVDLSIQSEASANMNLNAIKEFSPFNEYLLGERLGLFGETQTGTQIYIWNLDKWGSNFSLEWVEGGETVEGALYQNHSDILIRSRRLRSRPGQISLEVPLDYSLHAYLEVIFLDPRVKIYVQGSLAYKRVGSMVHSADISRGVLGVVDVSNLMDDEKGHVWVLNNKQGFQDCEAYAKVEEWLGSKIDEYCDENFDRVDLETGSEECKPDHEWVQCDKCRKWRILSTGFDSDSLPPEWFCYMPPFNGKCETPEQQIARGVITVAAKRSRCDIMQPFRKEEVSPPKSKNISPTKRQRCSYSKSPPVFKQTYEGESEVDSIETEDYDSHPKLKRLRRAKGPSRSSKR